MYVKAHAYIFQRGAKEKIKDFRFAVFFVDIFYMDKHSICPQVYIMHTIQTTTLQKERKKNISLYTPITRVDFLYAYVCPIVDQYLKSESSSYLKHTK